MHMQDVTFDVQLFRHFNEETVKVHESMLREMIERDFNHPSVIMWSVSNEPETFRNNSKLYFQ